MMNAVDETRRRSFESDWLRGSRRDISDYLPTPEDPSFLGTLEELICIDLEFRWRELASSATDKGNSMASTIKSLPAVEDYLGRFPQLKQPSILQRLLDQEIRARVRTPFRPTVAECQRRFPELETTPDTLRRLLQEAEQATQYQMPSSVRTTTPDHCGNFGKYELLEVLGRGGMGVVYRARQTQADRLVAIKIANVPWQNEAWKKEVTQRFESEIRAAAKLSHENVLPVFDVGEVDGSTYYTMPILSGDLAGEVRKQPLASDRAARYLSQAARGVAAAHGAGLLHRDIKPHNLLLDRESDRVVVSDFGLARLAVIDQSITRTGEIHGSPPYMSPEQIREPKNIDARADIYALGATLYHLLVGRPPFQAATPAETMLQSLEEDPVLPRVLNRRIDRDLETICLRCLHKDREHRFASAKDLADDLDRYLRHEPIVSRPLSSWERLMRWRRRNPTVALLSASLVAALLLVAIVSAWGWYRADGLLGRVVANNKQGQTQISKLLTLIRTEPLLDQPGGEMIRRDLLTEALRHYERLMALAAENESLVIDKLAAQKEAGLLSLDLSEPAAAEEHFHQVIKSAAALPKEQQEILDMLKILGDAWNGLGQSQHAQGDEQNALTSFDRAIEIRKQVVAKDEHDHDTKRKLANALMNHGLILARNGKVDAARAEEETAQRLRRELEGIDAKDHRFPRDLRRDLAQGEFNLARLDLTNSNREAGMLRLTNATDQFHQLIRDYPTDAKIWLRYAECLLTQSMFSTGAPQEDGENPTLIALEWMEAVAHVAPKNRTYQIRLVELYEQAIEQLLRAKKADVAEKSWQDMRPKLLDQLDLNDQRIDTMTVRLNGKRLWAWILLDMGRIEEAKREVPAALDAWRAAKELSGGEAFSGPKWEKEWTDLEKLANSL